MPRLLNVNKGLAVTNLGGPKGTEASTFYTTLRKLDLILRSPGSRTLFFYRLTRDKTFTFATLSHTCKYNYAQFGAY